MYLQSLLRHHSFKIRNDNKNLLFFKIYCIALSEFNFPLEFVPGIDNNIADAMPILCRNNMIDSPTKFSEDHVLSSISETPKSDKQQYVKIGKMYKSFENLHSRSWFHKFDL